MRTERAIPCSTTLEFRSTPKGHNLTGYAAVFGAESAPLPYIETVAPGAFVRSLHAPPNGRQTLVVDHEDDRLLASTRTDRLRLSEDSTGLLVDADLVDTSYARDLRELSDAGELGGMSFEFTATKGSAPFSADGKRRTLREVRLYHVTVLTGKTPAYAETTAAVRSLANRLEVAYDDLGAVLDAVREGRRLDADEWSLLERVVARVAPDGQRMSEAAQDATTATYALQTVLHLMSGEAAEPDHLALLKTASDALQAYVAAESSEIGTPADAAASACCTACLDAGCCATEGPSSCPAGCPGGDCCPACWGLRARPRRDAELAALYRFTAH